MRRHGRRKRRRAARAGRGEWIIMQQPAFGYLYAFRNPAFGERPWPQFYAEMLDVIAETEALGFAGAYMSEHHLADDGHLCSPMIMLAAIAARTRTMRLTGGVMLGPLYDPVRLAEDSAALANLSDGRLDLGLGLGYRRREAAAMGIDFGTRAGRFNEMLQIMPRLWAGETLDWDSKHFQLERARITPPPPGGRVPIFIGGFADKAIMRAVTLGDGFVGPVPACERYVQLMAEAGRDPAEARVRIYDATFVVADDPAAAVEELAPYFLHVNNSYAGWAAEDGALGAAGMTAMSLEDYKASGALKILTPEEGIAHIRSMAHLKPEQVVLPMPTGLPPERLLHYAGVFASKVMPAFR
jgi:alkanesulfonate monooxygenase SsuD/methylene tetrahydromethanopterin reductase-like flavin-dependent oxidoreductase (luciferase family)